MQIPHPQRFMPQDRHWDLRLLADNKRKIYLKSWDAICAPKIAEGLSFQCFRDQNEAFRMKLGGQICNNPWKT